MKNKKTLLKLLVGILTLCLLFSGCSKDKEGDETDGSDTSTDSSNVLPDDWYTADTDGVVDLSEYSVVRSANASQEIIKVTSQLRGYINSFCGLNVTMKTDAKPATGKEILVGETNRTASEEAYDGIKERNWAVTVTEDGNIVLSSGADTTMNLAVSWIEENCLQEKNKYALIGDGTSFEYSYPLTSITVGATDIKDMTVAYLNEDNVGFVDAAYMLAYGILDSYGEPVPVEAYNATASKKYIVVASSAQAAKYRLADGVTIGAEQYIVKESNGSILIVAKDATGADMGVQALTGACGAATDGSVDLAASCSDSVRTVNYGTDKLALMEGAQYRVMSFNVWRYQFEGTGAGIKEPVRMENAKKTMQYYSPDIVGFQEYCVKYTEELTAFLTQNGYTVVGNDKVTSSDDTTTYYTESQNYAPLAFKTDKFELVASGWQRLANTYDKNATYANYYPGHNVTWAVLEDKTTGQQMLVTSTHFYQHNGDANADDVRTKNAEELVALIGELREQYDCPVIAVGDYNMTEESDGYDKIIESGFLNDARYVATREYAACGGYHTWSECVVTEGTDKAIDHVFTTSEVEVIRHKLGISQMTANAADHFPVIVDFSIA